MSGTRPAAERLGQAEKMRLIASLKATGPASVLANRVSALAEPVPDARTDFTQHPLFVQTETQLAALSALGIANPFLAQHEGRAGARTRIEGRELINFASYDYLGLNGDPRIAEAAETAIRASGTSVSASRMVAGERDLHRALEAAIARLTRSEDAIAFVSGHATNVSTIATLLGARDLIVHDSLSHNSIVVGAELCKAARRAFPHGDLDQLEAILADGRDRFERVLIVVEGLYSMDGDVPDLKRLVQLKRRYDAWLMVDEAHALGVLGDRGYGSAEAAGIDPGDVDIWMGTLSKTLASCGGYIAGSRALITILKHHAAGFVFSVGLSPPLAAAALAALEVLEAEPARVERLQANGKRFLAAARARGLDTGHSAGHAIAPILVGDSLKAVALSERLLARGINVLPIVFPAVPMQAARLRFFLSSEHTDTDIDAAVAAVGEELEALDAEGFGVATLIDALAQRR